MSLARTTRVTVEAGVKAETLPLQPHEYFVLSRIEGTLTVAEIIGVSGLGAAQTEEILEKLIDLGALKTVEGLAAPAVHPRRRASTQELRAQAQERRRELLQRQLGAHVKAPSERRTPTPAPRPPEPEPEPEPAARVVEPAAPDDPRLDRSLGLSVDEQRHLLALEDCREELTPFELLGLHPTHDLKAIRAAFHQASRRYHPDAFHGRSLGRFRGQLDSLFARAKSAYQDLLEAEHRDPLVEAYEAERNAARQQVERRRQQQDAARQAAEELRARREREAAAGRRAAREAKRAERGLQQTAAAARGKIEELVKAAEDAEGMENFARAANNYRLALQHAPDDAELRARWEATRTKARRLRAKDAFARACTYVEVGQSDQAISLFLEAADANPTLEHLAHAADAVAVQEPDRARQLAMGALGLLTEAEQSDAPLRGSVVADLRLMIGRAFLAAGLAESAKEQALLAQRIRPKDPQARALLKSAKVT